jgi:hypothetical protein
MVKRILLPVLFLLLATRFYAQAKLDITRLANLPDTVTLYEQRNITATVKNIGNAVFSGLVYFDISVDSGNGGTPVIFRLDSAYVNLAAAGGLDSSLSFYKVGIVPFSGFKVGGNGNTVVIWPRAKNNLIPNDSIKRTIYVKPNLVFVHNLEAFSSGLSLSPNPASSQVTISSTQPEAIAGYRLLDVSGKEVLKDNYTQQIDLRDIEKGLYVIEFLDRNKRRLAVKKLLIQ